MIIAVANQKGGVGKTTTVVNLGTALARKGKTVLCIDFDPQANLTSYVACEPGEETVATVMRAAALFQPADLGAAVCRSDKFGFDFLPADLRLSEADIYLATAMSRETVLRRVLEPLRQAYDYILIDCNPSLGLKKPEPFFTPLTWANAPNCCPVNGLRATRRWPGRYAWKAAGRWMRSHRLVQRAGARCIGICG